MRLLARKQPSRSQPAKKRVTPASLVTLSLVSVLFGILVLELMFYFKPKLMPVQITAFFHKGLEGQPSSVILDDALGYVYAPGLVNYAAPFQYDNLEYTISTVSLGYENIGFRDDGLDGEPYAVVVGDSFTSCLGLEAEQCWVELLEASQGQDFVNMGVPGYSPQQEKLMLTNYGLPLNPELVLWTFFQNDLIDAWQFNHFGKLKQYESWPGAINSWFTRNSNVYLVLAYFWYNRHFFYNVAFSDDEMLANDSDLAWWQANTDLSKPDISEGLNLTQAAILQAYQQVRSAENEVKFVVLFVPSREQLRYAASPFQDGLDGPNRALIDFCKQHGIPFIDLTPKMKAFDSDQIQSLFFDRDMHLNAQGNEIMAHLIEEDLEIMFAR